MNEWDDHALLREYVDRDSEEAFAALVARHVNKVYSAAHRQTGNAHAAEEITQAVFVILARKCRRLGRRVILSGWLYQTARLTAVTFIRSEIRRNRREQEAHMQSELNEPEVDPWPQIAPWLESAMADLNEADRHAVVLRFFDGKSLKEVGAALGANEENAKKRVQRAVDKLRRFLTKRGMILSAAALTAAISANSVQAAPAGMAHAVASLALTKDAVASGSTLTLAKGTIKFMVWTNVKTAIVIAAAVLVAAGTTMVVVNNERVHPASRKLILKIDPEVFIRNVKAQAAGTMHLPSDPWGDIWLDILTMARVDSTPPHATEFNPKDGTMAMSNTPAALEIFRQLVEELNRPE